MKFTIWNLLRIAGIIITIVYLTYYFIKPYKFIPFMAGFLVIYIFFIKLLPVIEKRFTKKT